MDATQDTMPTPQVPAVDIGGMIGSGGFGAVYRGRHRTLDVDVAVKIVGGAAAALELALAEARLIARLDHPNLVRIHDAGRLGPSIEPHRPSAALTPGHRSPPSIYLILELMDGGSLAQVHDMPGDELAAIAAQLLAGLQALHDARIVHRDIKPANCLVRTRDRRIKLADFGIAAEHTRAAGEFAGTLAFMAPELFEDTPRYDARTDLYALGMSLACLALPATPFPTGSTAELIDWVRAGPRPRVTTARADVDALIECLLATKPGDRPADAAEALAMLLARAPPRLPAAAGDRRVGPWSVGDVIYDSSNWRACAATHVDTGAPARFNHVQPDASVLVARDTILDAAARASRLDHPGLLAVLDWGVDDDRPYVVCGPHARSLLELGAQREIDALDFVADLADAVAFLHARGLVYQIVEPGAALVLRSGRGAQLGWPVYCVRAGTPLEEAGVPRRAGVPQFMAPEAFASTGTIDPPVDCYGLGEVLHFLCAGAPAYAGDTIAQIADAKDLPPPPLPPAITRPTARLAGELMAADPNQRPSAAAARDELRLIASRLRGG